ncbi:MAG: chemotaxis protein CheW [Cellulomonas sp.]|nr:chemotaxis protein CheW [Cellulomonas sp.]
MSSPAPATSTPLSPGTTTEPASSRYLTFTLNTEIFGLDIANVTEILELRHLTTVPMMPAFIRGVINLRGRVVPVIDLAIRFSRGTTAIAHRTSIIIIRIENPDQDATQDIGILVDAVNEVVHLEPEDIESAPAFGAGIRADYISGMARREHDFTILLDINRVLSLTDMLTLDLAADEGALGS